MSIFKNQFVFMLGLLIAVVGFRKVMNDQYINWYNKCIKKQPLAQNNRKYVQGLSYNNKVTQTLISYLLKLMMDKLTGHIQNRSSWCMLFVNDIDDSLGLITS